MCLRRRAACGRHHTNQQSGRHPNPVLRFLKKPAFTPTKLTDIDARAVLEAGWSERALYDAVLIGCLYGFMNRHTNGRGLTPIPEQFEMEGKLIREGSYKGMLAMGIK